MAYADLTTLNRLNQIASEYHYRRAYGNGKPHPSHVTEQATDEEIIRELVGLAERYAQEMRSYLPLAVAKAGRR